MVSTPIARTPSRLNNSRAVSRIRCLAGECTSCTISFCLSIAQPCSNFGQNSSVSKYTKYLSFRQVMGHLGFCKNRTNPFSPVFEKGGENFQFFPKDDTTGLDKNWHFLLYFVQR